MLCHVASVKSLPVHHHCAGYILFTLGSLSPSCLFGILLKPALGGIFSLANYSVAYEETQSSRVINVRDFVCSLLPKAVLFCLLFYSNVAGVVTCGGSKKSPRTSS